MRISGMSTAHKHHLVCEHSTQPSLHSSQSPALSGRLVSVLQPIVIDDDYMMIRDVDDMVRVI